MRNARFRWFGNMPSSWNIEPIQKLGSLGFSAGGHLLPRSARNSHTVDRTMDAVDALFCATWFFSKLVYPVIIFVNPAYTLDRWKPLLGDKIRTIWRDVFCWVEMLPRNPSNFFLVHAEMTLEFRWKIHCCYYCRRRARGFLPRFMYNPKGGQWILLLEREKGPVENLRDVLLDWIKAPFKNWLFWNWIFLKTLKIPLRRRWYPNCLSKSPRMIMVIVWPIFWGNFRHFRPVFFFFLRTKRLNPAWLVCGELFLGVSFCWFFSLSKVKETTFPNLEKTDRCYSKFFFFK